MTLKPRAWKRALNRPLFLFLFASALLGGARPAHASVTVAKLLCPQVAIAADLLAIIKRGYSSYNCTYNASLLFFDWRQSYSGDTERKFQTDLAQLIAKGKNCQEASTAALAQTVADDWASLKQTFLSDYDPSQAPLCVGTIKFISCVDFTGFLTPGLNAFCTEVSELMKDIAKLGNAPCTPKN